MIPRAFKRISGVGLAAFLFGLAGGAALVYALVMWVALMLDPTAPNGAHFLIALVLGVVLAGIADALNERRLP